MTQNEPAVCLNEKDGIACDYPFCDCEYADYIEEWNEDELPEIMAGTTINNVEWDDDDGI